MWNFERTPENRNYFHPSNGFTEVIYGIYRIYNRKSGKSYVGQASGSRGIYGRWYDHWKYLMRNTHKKHPKLQAAWNKYAGEDWVFGVVEECDRAQAILNARESHWINYFNAVDHGYNLSPTPSTTLGLKMTPEQRQHMSAAQLRRYQDPEQCRLQGIQRIGRTHTAETKEKMRQTGKLKGAPKCAGHNKGVPMSNEQRLQLSKIRTGTQATEATKEKLRAQPRGKFMYRGEEMRRIQETDIPNFLALGWTLGKVPGRKRGPNKKSRVS